MYASILLKKAWRSGTNKRLELLRALRNLLKLTLKVILLKIVILGLKTAKGLFNFSTKLIYRFTRVARKLGSPWTELHRTEWSMLLKLYEGIDKK